MPRIGTVLLKGSSTTYHFIVCIVAAGADKLDRSVLKAVCIYEKSLVEVHSKVHLFGVVLVERANILVQIALVKNTVEALTRLDLTKLVLSLVGLVANAFISHRKVRWHIDIILQVNLVIKIAEAL